MLGTRMESEIREQIHLLKQNWGSYDDQLRSAFRGESYEMAVLVARGSSDNAASYARYLLEIYLGIPVVLAAPSVLTRYKRDIRYPKSLAVGISQSGAAPDVAEVLQKMRDQGHRTLAITNTQGSAVAEAADTHLFLNLGTERAVAATKTYSASLLAVYGLARALGGELECPQIPDSSWLEESRSSAERDHKLLLYGLNLFALARGIRFCSASECALKLMECALLPCLAYSIADYQHGPKALATDDTVAVVFGPSQEGLAAIQAPIRAGVPEPIQPLWDAMYAQWLALLCARAKDLDPDKPEGLTKVTKTL